MLTLRDSTAEAEFRREVRTWVDENLTDSLRHSEKIEDLLTVDRLLAAARLLGVGWPQEYGGRGVSPLLEAVCSEELGRAGVLLSKLPSRHGIHNIGPGLMAHGSPEQKERFLPRILSAADVWCQGFSEPEAGSDLANVRTSAALQGDELILNGSKIWTTQAQLANWMYALVRTGKPGERHKGLTLVLVPLETPGIVIRPIQQSTGKSEFAEVFFTDVAVPRELVLGEIDDGWRVAMTVLTSERASSRRRYWGIRRDLDELCWEASQALGTATAPMPDRDYWLTQVGRIWARVSGIETLSLRIDSRREAGEGIGGLGSINKLWWPAAHQDLTEIGIGLASANGGDSGRWYAKWLETRAESIYGGSAEIQRDLLGERVMGLPRDR